MLLSKKVELIFFKGNAEDPREDPREDPDDPPAPPPRRNIPGQGGDGPAAGGGVGIAV